MNIIFPRMAAVAVTALALDVVAQPPQIALDVRKRQETDTEQKATRSSLTKEQDRVVELTIGLRNNDPKEQAIKVSWYFVANPLLGGLDNFVYDKGEQAMTMAPRSATNLTQAARPIGTKVHTSRHSAKKQGAKPLGYIVTVTQDTNLIAVAASPMSFERVARKPEELQKLIATPAPPEL
jgi:hypothetical protein